MFRTAWPASARVAALLVASSAALACAHEPPEPAFYPYAGYPPPAWIASPSPAYAWNMPQGSPWAQRPNDAAGTINRADVPPMWAPAPQPFPNSRSIPDGAACLALLRSAGVDYRTIEDKRGVETPVEIRGAIGGVVYHPGAGLPFICDCRLAVALSWIAPIFRQFGVSDVRYSGVYVYRMSRVGRLSYHAYGLAIDLHEFTAFGRPLRVDRDYEKGLDAPCSPAAPLLNQLACRLKSTGLWREMLTPDYNADHHDHFHLGIARLDR